MTWRERWGYFLYFLAALSLGVALLVKWAFGLHFGLPILVWAFILLIVIFYMNVRS